MENKTYTPEEVIKFTIEGLRKINVPAEMAEQIGLPVLHAIRNLQAVANAMEASRVTEEMEKEGADGREAEAE